MPFYRTMRLGKDGEGTHRYVCEHSTTFNICLRVPSMLRWAAMTEVILYMYFDYYIMRLCEHINVVRTILKVHITLLGQVVLPIATNLFKPTSSYHNR